MIAIERIKKSEQGKRNKIGNPYYPQKCAIENWISHTNRQNKSN
jgi:hypothetical protein